ncbi:MAG: hypothetical protein JOY72_04405, partial [Actinobacteria bacterium]|nr:hypothetical protein [Actinomycetota bacterium]
MSNHENEPPILRTVAPVVGGLRTSIGGEYGVNELAELVADLLAATQLVPADELNLVRGKARQMGSFAQALVEEGVASSEGIARIVAARHQIPLVDLALAGVDEDAARLVPLHVLERVTAMPYALRGDTLLIAVADPANLHGIDELRLATRHPVELGVASRDDIRDALKRLARTSETFGARVALADDAEAEMVDQAETDLEIEDGVSDVPLVRLVNSILFQAAEDGASDI